MARSLVPRIRSIALLAVSITLAGGGAAHAANPAPPAVTTGGAEDVATSGATLTGSATANGADTTVHFEFGTTAGYGVKTDPVQVPADAVAQPVRTPVLNLTAGTTYHVRVVATNAAGTVFGEDKMFTTVGTPKPPYAQTRSVVDRTSGGATLMARVEPRSQPTTVYWEWGPSASYGLRTASQTIPGGNAPVLLRHPLTGLSANTEYSYRVVAVNAAGTSTGRRHTFRTTRGVSNITIKLAAQHVDWSKTAFIGGKVSGVSVGKATVTLWQQDHPFTGPFRAVATTVSTEAGTYGFTTKKLFWATRFRVTADTPSGVSSPTATTIGDLYTKLRVSSKRRKTARLQGYAYPAVAGTAKIQRRTPSGRWVTVEKSVGLKVDKARNRSSIAAWVPRLSTRTARYRMLVTPKDGGAHATTASRSAYVARR